MLPHLYLQFYSPLRHVFNFLLNISIWITHSQLKLTSKIKCITSTPLLYPSCRFPLCLFYPLPSRYSLHPGPLKFAFSVSFVGVGSLVHFLWPYRKSPCPVPCVSECQMSVISSLPPHCLWDSIHKVIHNNFQDSPAPMWGYYTSVISCTFTFPPLCFGRNAFPISAGPNPSFFAHLTSSFSTTIYLLHLKQRQLFSFEFQ